MDKLNFLNMANLLNKISLKTGLVLIFCFKKSIQNYLLINVNQVKYEIFQFSLKECQISDQKLPISKTIF